MCTDVINKQYLNSGLLKLRVVSLSWTVFHSLSLQLGSFLSDQFYQWVSTIFTMLPYIAQQPLKACRNLKNHRVYKSRCQGPFRSSLKIQQPGSCGFFLNWQGYPKGFLFGSLKRERGWRCCQAHSGRKQMCFKNGWHVLAFVISCNKTWQKVSKVLYLFLRAACRHLLSPHFLSLKSWKCDMAAEHKCEHYDQTKMQGSGPHYILILQ